MASAYPKGGRRRRAAPGARQSVTATVARNGAGGPDTFDPEGESKTCFPNAGRPRQFSIGGYAALFSALLKTGSPRPGCHTWRDCRNYSVSATNQNSLSAL